jgi:hypothetical protein
MIMTTSQEANGIQAQRDPSSGYGILATRLTFLGFTGIGKESARSPADIVGNL